MKPEDIELMTSHIVKCPVVKNNLIYLSTGSARDQLLCSVQTLPVELTGVISM